MNYASIREEWYFMKREERLERDAGRTRAHESLISSVKYLKRYLVNIGKDVSFFGVLEDENEIIQRKKIGDCACVVSGLLGIISR